MPNDKAKKAQLSVTIDAELVEWVKAEAEKREVGPSYLVGRALRAHREALAGNHNDAAVVAAIDSLRANDRGGLGGGD